MSDDRTPGVALLVGCNRKRDRLSEVVQHFGYRVVFTGEPEALEAGQLAEVPTDLWLLDMAEDSPLLDWLLDSSEVPVLLGNDEIPPPRDEDYPRWQRRLYGKLCGLLGAPPSAPKLQVPTSAVAVGSCSVWLLGASLGGPAAVKSFLDAVFDAVHVNLVNWRTLHKDLSCGLVNNPIFPFQFLKCLFCH